MIYDIKRHKPLMQKPMKMDSTQWWLYSKGKVTATGLGNVALIQFMSENEELAKSLGFKMERYNSFNAIKHVQRLPGVTLETCDNEEAHKDAVRRYVKEVQLCNKVYQDELFEYGKQYCFHEMTIEMHNKIYERAYDKGHSEGHSAIESSYNDLCDFVNEIISLQTGENK